MIRADHNNQRFFSTQHVDKKRIITSYEENCNLSLPNTLLGSNGSQIKTSLKEFNELRNKKTRVAKSSEMIQDHLDRRVALFFQQLVVCYNVPFHFEIGKTHSQAPSSKTVTIQHKKASIQIPFQSAHSSTLPCLYAYPKEDYDQWTNNQQAEKKPDGFVYLKGSHFYHDQNATLGLIAEVNRADCLLDGTANRLRSASIELINSTAKGTLLPQDGLRAFLESAETIIACHLKDPKTKEELKAVFSLYQERIKDLIKESQEHSFFDRLLDIRIDDEKDTDAALRAVLYRHRFHIIRISHEKQSVIAKKISDLSLLILAKEKKKPACFAKAVKQKIFSLAENDDEKAIFSKIFCRSQEEINQYLSKKSIHPAAAQKLVNNHKNSKRFQQLMEDIREIVAEMQKEELLFRSQITRDLRLYKAWTQEELATNYKKKFHASLSQPTISRLETTIKPMDQKIAHRLAKLFEVDPGIFFPALFT